MRNIVKTNWETARGIDGIENDVRRINGTNTFDRPSWKWPADFSIEGVAPGSYIVPELANQILVATQGSCSADNHADHVRLVIMMQCCDESIIEYTQAAGRAARDQKPGIVVSLGCAIRKTAVESPIFPGDLTAMRQLAGLAPIGDYPCNVPICRRVPPLLYFDGNLDDANSHMPGRINGDLVDGINLARTCITTGFALCDNCHHDVEKHPSE